MVDQGKESPRSAPRGYAPVSSTHFLRSKSMTAGSKKSVAPSTIPQFVKTDVDRVLESGLADFSIRELLGLLLSNTGAAERKVFLENTPYDKANGFYERSVQLGTIPVDVRVPRTRKGDF